jgi:UDP-N-acetylglucosamine 2-epimerase (non-hydrolysing)
MRKVMTIVGTRPELVKMSLVIGRLDESFRHVLVHTGQNADYELNQVFFDDLGIRKPDYFLEAAGGTAAETIGRIIAKVDEVLEAERPEAVLIYGDTNSGLSVIAAKRRQIPIFHLEAGNRCFDQRVPEELNRKVIDHLSDINMVLTEHARRYLLAEGLPGDRIFTIGSNMAEVIARFRDRIERSSILDRLDLARERFILVSAHREENVDVPDRLDALVRTLTRLAADFDMPVIVSTHPRTRQRLAALGNGDPGGAVRWLLPFGYTDYARLQLEAFCVVSDSGTITEEASLLDLPAVTIRDAHERPEGMDAGTLMMSALAPDAVVAAVHLARRGPCGRRFSGAVPGYEVADASTKVVRIVASYIDVVNRVVWRK